MTTALPEDQRLVNLSSKAYEHPADRAATAALQTVPMLDVVVRKLIEFGYERAFRQQFLAASVRLGEDQLPKVWGDWNAGCARLDPPERYDLYLTQFPITNAAAYRAAELSSDRAATLVNRDPLVTCRTMMVLAGGVSARKLDLDAFIRQANDYDEWKSGWDRLNRMRAQLSLTHSYPVRRVKEIMAWVQSGEYDRIAAGEYPTRDQQADARKEAGDAFEFYKDRFRRIFNEFGGERVQEKAADAAGKLSDWLRPKNGGGEGKKG